MSACRSTVTVLLVLRVRSCRSCKGLELVHGGVELENGATAHGPVLRSAGTSMLSTPGMFHISAPAAAYRTATACNGA